MVHPVLTLSLDVQVISGKGGRGKNVVASVISEGASAEAQINPQSLVVESSPVPKLAVAGVTPLPPEWDLVGKPTAMTAQTVKAGRTLTLSVEAADSESEPYFLRAKLAGTVVIREPKGTHAVAVSLSSKAVRVGR